MCVGASCGEDFREGQRVQSTYTRADACLSCGWKRRTKIFRLQNPLSHRVWYKATIARGKSKTQEPYIYTVIIASHYVLLLWWSTCEYRERRVFRSQLERIINSRTVGNNYPQLEDTLDGWWVMWTETATEWLFWIICFYLFFPRYSRRQKMTNRLVRSCTSATEDGTVERNRIVSKFIHDNEVTSLILSQIVQFFRNFRQTCCRSY